MIIVSHASFAGALHTVLEQAGFDTRLMDTNTSPAALVSAVVQRAPDVVVLGSDLDYVGDGPRLVAPLAGAGLSVVVLAGHTDDPVRWGVCLAQGAKAVVRRTVSLDQFVTLVRGVAAGSFVPSPEQEVLLRDADDEVHAEERALLRRVARLTDREREILVDLARGRAAAEIAAARFVSEGTVRTQIRAILHKLEVSSQIAAVAVAHRTGVTINIED
jgi:two-component system nitrate/nitrite response regulator NarL